MPASKEILRKRMLKRLKTQKEEWVRKKSGEIKNKLFRLKAFKQAKTVMFYLAFKSEVETRLMIEEAIKLGKRIAVPVCDIKAKKIIPCLVKTSLETAGLKKGAYGIEEPRGKNPISSAGIDLCVVPGLAFDLKGNRLGRGMGYYDRFLGGLPGSLPKIGLAFKFQVSKQLACCLPHDIRVDKVISA